MLFIDVAIILISVMLLVRLSIWRITVARQPTQKQPLRRKRMELDLQVSEPYPQQPFKQSGRYHMTMGLRRLDAEIWAIVDKHYTYEHKIRADILSSKKTKVFRCLPGSEDACAEVLNLVVNFLIRKHPAMFKIVEGIDKVKSIKNTETGEVFSLQRPFYGMEPLEVVARLVSEDVNVLMKRHNQGEHCLVASASLFPVGWSVEDRIGWPVSQLHGTVPLWQEKIGPSVERYIAIVRVKF
ncbi:MAG: hypothetical protein M1830_000661 [Pleopsidium flavum]|nr:MAG: hypothetical protein M1830_000661 [Pleopsidium flavum]